MTALDTAALRKVGPFGLPLKTFTALLDEVDALRVKVARVEALLRTEDAYGAPFVLTARLRAALDGAPS